MNQALQYDKGKYYYIERFLERFKGISFDKIPYAYRERIKSNRIEVALESVEMAEDLCYKLSYDGNLLFSLPEGIYPVQVKVNYKYTKKPPYRYAILSEVEDETNEVGRKCQGCGSAEFTKVKKMYLHDFGYFTYISNNKEVKQNFKNVFISDNNKANDPNYWMSIRVNRDTEIEDMRIAMIMTNSIEMASLCIDLCSWVETLSVTHGIEDEESSKMVKRLRELARPR